jgi:hypothetical protein
LSQVSKLQSIQDAVSANDFKKAFGIARKFFFGLTPDERKCIEIAADSLSGRSAFYATIGVDVDAAIVGAKDVLLAKWGIS